jgi:hypothetical protein
MRWIVAAAALVLFATTGWNGVQSGGGREAVQFSADGAWCWFQDPRAVFVRGEHVRTYASWMTSRGALQVGAYDHTLRTAQIRTVKDHWDVDDHNAGSLLVLPDRRLMIFYARHNGRGLYCRVSTQPEEITSWGPEVTITSSDRITYSHPVYLKSEQKFFVFFRGETWKPTVCTSEDGVQWTDPLPLIQDAGRGSHDIRPYLKVTTDGDSTIHFAFTDGHPRDEPLNSVYYLRYTRGEFFRGDGSFAGSLSEAPVAHTRADRVYDARSTGARAWVWDISLDRQGQPCIAYTRLPEEDDHRYHVARRTPAGWSDTEVVRGGGWFPETPPGTTEREPHYSGGMAFVPGSAPVVYTSRQAGREFLVERWELDERNVWRPEPAPGTAGRLDVRPVVPRGLSNGEEIVLWMEGRYVHYTDYATRIWMHVRHLP